MDKTKKNALIVTAFYSYDLNVRLVFLEEALLSRGYHTTIVSSNFDHRKKVYFSSPKDNVVLLQSPRYKKNLSIGRIKAHVAFSRAVLEYCNKSSYDLIYAITPPNTLFSALGSYKKRNPKVKVICEIEDLWPESLPVSSFVKLFFRPFLGYWSNKRNKSLKWFDALVFECRLHLSYIGRIDSSLNCKVARLGKSGSCFNAGSNDIAEAINFLYLGSINNLIDYKLIVHFLKAVARYRKVFLTIIGGGERTKPFERLLQKEKISFCNYGTVFEDEEKKHIVARCHFGLNIMKKSVFVGVTMKSLDYFGFGLPIVNNIVGDTFDIIDNYHCGINLGTGELSTVAQRIGTLGTKEYQEMVANSQYVFDLAFSKKAVVNQLGLVIDEVEGEKNECHCNTGTSLFY